MITQKYLNELFTYDGKNLFWKLRPSSHFSNDRICHMWNIKFSGKVVGSKDRKGYLKTKIDGKDYKVHRLVFMLIHGYLPEIIDHKDGDKSNNSIDNLRDANKYQNAQNISKRSSSICGLKGVTLSSNSKRFVANIDSEGKRYYLGIYDTEEEAHQAYCVASEKLHGDFGRFH